MKSAYCIAITACLTVIWLRKEKAGDGGESFCWRSSSRVSDYALYSLPFLIKSSCSFLEVAWQ